MPINLDYGGATTIGGSYNNSSNRSGTFYLPWQENAMKASTQQLQGQLGSGTGPGDMSRYAQWGGEPQKFTGINPSPIYSPELINQASNAIWGSALAQGRNQAMQANSLRPGFGSMSPFLRELQAGIGARAAATGQQNMLNWQQTAAQQNAGNILEGQKMNLAAETARAQAEQNRYNLMQGVRAQDVQRENALLTALGRYMQPLSYSQGSSNSFSPVYA